MDVSMERGVEEFWWVGPGAHLRDHLGSNLDGLQFG